MLEAATRAVLAAYPALLTACRRREVREPASGVRLSPRLATILELLHPEEPVVVGELARRLGVTPATVSLQLTRLVRLRLVRRARDPQDRRRVELRLTAAGGRVRAAASLLDPERVRAALGRVPPRKRNQIVAGLRDLARAAGQLPNPRPSRGSRPR